MKFKDLIQKKPRRPLKIIITEKQFKRLSSSVVTLMEQEKITKTYLINSKPNGK
jgi:hypothetical protein